MSSLTPIQLRFINHCAQMGRCWGLNRAAAKVQALLFVVSEPLKAKGIAELLDISRSSVTASLRNLQVRGLAQPVHVLGDKDSYYQGCKNVVDIVRTVLDERKRRELDPLIKGLGVCIEIAKKENGDGVRLKRLVKFQHFLQLVSEWYTRAFRPGLPLMDLLALALSTVGEEIVTRKLKAKGQVQTSKFRTGPNRRSRRSAPPR